MILVGFAGSWIAFFACKSKQFLTFAPFFVIIDGYGMAV